jgi:hypothetical protein
MPALRVSSGGLSWVWIVMVRPQDEGRMLGPCAREYEEA